MSPGFSTTARRRASRIFLATACALAVVITGGCRSSGTKDGAAGTGKLRPLNVVLVTLDTLRPDRLGCYGYGQIETPNLDGIAKGGTLFENAMAQTPLTAPSHASMFTGQNPPVHKVRDTGGFVFQPSTPVLAEILQGQGWDTAAFVGASVLRKSFGFNRGFAVYDDDMSGPEMSHVVTEFPERRAGAVVDRAVQWLGSQQGKPFFLWVHVFDPHSPYDPPSPFREKYAGRPYDGEVAYTDQEMGRLFEAIRRKAPENTLIAVLSDHGESLSEHGEYTHGVFLYDSTVRIAWIMAGPGVPQGRRISQQVQSIDLLPTLIELMGGRAPKDINGISLAPALSGKPVAATETYLETLYPKINMGWTELRGLRTDRWKYIRAPKPELYDLAADPGEVRNVIGDYPVEAKELEERMRAVIGSGAGSEKVEMAMVDQKTMQQLRSLGYAAGSAQREFTLTGSGVDPKDRIDVLKLLYMAMSPDARHPASQRVPLLRQAVAADPANPTLYFHLGDEFQKAGRHAEAAKLYQDGIRNGVRTAWIYSRLGHLQLRQGAREQAIESYETAAQLNPSDCDSLSDLGLIYMETGRIGDAERVFQWCLATGEEHALTHNGMGLVAIRKQDLTSARIHFEKAVALDPSLLEAYLNLGRIYKIRGAYTRARECFETFLAKASPSEYGHIIPRIRAELESMR